ncbi:methyl-accepting chemotaxis protein [Chitinibacter bivalviorum]|uniref:methyl-accepting chemotaxis protein n=1 Tax=Chitinibacter bivalviorum TaxID=2739434 RepID=UPI001C54B19C|nr:cache domain-containing protein [Chitinibacter bivalviorum]
MIFLFGLRIRTRLLLLSLLALFGMTLLSVMQLSAQRQSMLDGRMALVKTQTESAASVIEHYRSLSKNGQLSDTEAQTAAIAALRNVRYNKSDYFFIFDTQYVYKLQPSKPEVEGQNKGDQQDSNGKYLIKDMVRAAQNGGGFVDYHFAKIGAKTPEPKVSYAMLIPDWNWVVGTGVYIDDIDHEFKSNLLWGLLQLIIMAIVLSIVAWLITFSILRQLGGEPQEAIAIMRRVADGDLQADTAQAAPGSLLATLGEMSCGLRKIIQQIRHDAAQLGQQATQIADSSREISIAANRQADATTSMAAAMEELTVSINHISESSEITRTTSAQATTLAQEGVGQVAMASSSMEDIAHTVAGATEQIRSLDAKAHEISGIAAVIKDIAGQTNLLALNAAIEAARAGEQGRGFAVVADEVRKLAERTSNATIDITQMLAAVQEETMSIVGMMDKAIPQVNQGVELSRNVAQSLGHIQAGAQSTLSHLNEVAEATREQGVASNNIASRVEDISQMVEETSISIAHSADNAMQVNSIAQQLNQLLSRFKI